MLTAKERIPVDGGGGPGWSRAFRSTAMKKHSLKKSQKCHFPYAAMRLAGGKAALTRRTPGRYRVYRRVFVMPTGLGARARQRRFSKARSALRHRSKAACPASPWLRRACRAGAAAAKTGQGWLQSVAVSSSDIWMDFAAGMDAAPKWLNPADGQMAHNPASEPDFLAQRESFPAYLAAILNG